ncbi:phytanoyl-CoA dioxygenase family protein [Horticoccus luteus]|uniref:Phytanoyl-CoA dioxygenase family protein n=1 Tax=Horticoccus luteus TaxID=2862869 RepID=A0A8F9TTG7_9BACT|nr:phytanoyl-CoA dioxygenase family protein [Horticoccus luteus]QYM78735.1 phytanoyl-CoA dioxygenase family protein [Horticoccus luteus]
MPPSAFEEERDLSFQPAVNASPRALTQEQIAFYNERGYIKPLDAYTPAQADQNRAYFDDLLRKVQAARSDLDSYSINGFHLCCAGLYDIVTHPLILDHVQDLIGPDVICWGTHFFCKQPHDPRKVAWHQDASYWPFTPARTVTVWLAIDDADRDNAAMMFLPDTHRRGHLKWRSVAKDQAVLNQEIENANQLGEPVYDELKAGQFSLHADMLAHGSEPNHSARRRCGLTIRYCPPTVRALNPGWSKGAILCRGSSTADGWTYNARPVGENINLHLQAIGAN